MIKEILMIAAAMLSGFSPGVSAQEPAWPSKAVKIVLPYPPGGGTDTLLRTLGLQLSALWKTPVLIENRPGANTIIGAQSVASAAPDGYTFLFTSDSTITSNPFLYKNLPYSPQTDFTPVALVASTTFVLSARKDLPGNTLKEVLAYAKGKPGGLTYASLGVGSQNHLLSEVLGKKTGMPLRHIPYKGMSATAVALMTGEVDLAWFSQYSLAPLVRDNKAKAITRAGPERSPSMPDIPTFAELGYPEVSMPIWFGLFAPRATPAEIIRKVHDDVMKVISNPEFINKEILTRGYEPGPATLTSEGFAERIKQDLPKMREMIQDSGAKLD